MAAHRLVRAKAQKEAAKAAAKAQQEAVKEDAKAQKEAAKAAAKVQQVAAKAAADQQQAAAKAAAKAAADQEVAAEAAAQEPAAQERAAHQLLAVDPNLGPLLGRCDRCFHAVHEQECAPCARPFSPLAMSASLTCLTSSRSYLDGFAKDVPGGYRCTNAMTCKEYLHETAQMPRAKRQRCA